MDLWNIPRQLVIDAACRKAALPAWRVAAVSITTGLWATVRFMDGPTVTVYRADVL